MLPLVSQPSLPHNTFTSNADGLCAQLKKYENEPDDIIDRPQTLYDLSLSKSATFYDEPHLETTQLLPILTMLPSVACLPKRVRHTINLYDPPDLALPWSHLKSYMYSPH